MCRGTACDGCVICSPEFDDDGRRAPCPECKRLTMCPPCRERVERVGGRIARGEPIDDQPDLFR